MTKKDVIEFFDRCAPDWDAGMVRNEDVISRILDNGGVRPGVELLDVACGTGVLFPDYLARKVGSITGVDISPEMARIASGKFPGKISVICGDVEEIDFDRHFDVIMVYNAFPHFPEPEHLIEGLCGLLNSGGRLSIAHGMSREAITRHHSGSAAKVSVGLMDERELAALISKWLEVDVAISDEKMYQVSGFKR